MAVKFIRIFRAEAHLEAAPAVFRAVAGDDCSDRLCRIADQHPHRLGVVMAERNRQHAFAVQLDHLFFQLVILHRRKRTFDHGAVFLKLTEPGIGRRTRFLPVEIGRCHGVCMEERSGKQQRKNFCFH